MDFEVLSYLLLYESLKSNLSGFLETGPLKNTPNIKVIYIPTFTHFTPEIVLT